MLNGCVALHTNSNLCHLIDVDSLLGGGDEPIVASISVRHEVRPANLLNLSI